MAADAGGEGPSPLQLAQRLETQLMDETSPLRRGIVTCSAVAVRSRPSSAASSEAGSARGGRPTYDPRAAAAQAEPRPVGLREQLRRAREERKRRDLENPDEFDIQANSPCYLSLGSPPSTWLPRPRPLLLPPIPMFGLSSLNPSIHMLERMHMITIPVIPF